MNFSESFVTLRKRDVIAEVCLVYEFNGDKLPTKQDVHQNQVDSSEDFSKPLECESSEDLIKSEFNDDDFPIHLTSRILQTTQQNANPSVKIITSISQIISGIHSLMEITEPVFQILYHT